VVQLNREEAESGLEEVVATWLGEDPEHWLVLRLTLIDPFWKHCDPRLRNTTTRGQWDPM
jgi:hypothetical protein